MNVTKRQVDRFMRKPLTELFTCRYTVYAECRGIQMAKPKKTWLNAPNIMSGIIRAVLGYHKQPIARLQVI